jgi:hypothetical protein
VIQPTGPAKQIAGWAVFGGEVDETFKTHSEGFDRNNVPKYLEGTTQGREAAAESGFNVQPKILAEAAFEDAEIRARIDFGLHVDGVSIADQANRERNSWVFLIVRVAIAKMERRKS